MVVAQAAGQSAKAVTTPRRRQVPMCRRLVARAGLIAGAGARGPPRPGLPARRAVARRPVGSVLDGDRAPDPVAAHLGMRPAARPDLQRWTFALSAVVDEAIALILLCLAWRPLARPLLAQFLALALTVDVAANILFDPQVVVAYAALLLLLVVYSRAAIAIDTHMARATRRSPPGPRRRRRGRAVPGVWQALQAQVAGADELALNYGWASTVEHLVIAG